MRDQLTREQRYRAMVANRGRTRPELALAHALWRHGLRYLTADGYRRLGGPRLLGHPDIVFVGRHVVVFVDGCFWHGCPRCKGIPMQSGAFWRCKIETNVARDRRVTAELRREGWAVIRIPEHALRTEARLARTAARVARRVRARRSRALRHSSGRTSWRRPD